MPHNELYTRSPLAVYHTLAKHVGIFRQSCKEQKRNGKMFCRYAEWPKVADAVSEAKNCTLLFLSVATQNPSDLRHIAARERMGNMRCF